MKRRSVLPAWKEDDTLFRGCGGAARRDVEGLCNGRGHRVGFGSKRKGIVQEMSTETAVTYEKVLKGKQS